MKNSISIIIILLFATHFEMKGQLKSELISQILKSRSEFISDSIPNVFKQYYNRFTQTGDKPVFDAVNFYDTLKTLIQEASFPEKDFFWCEYLSDDFADKCAILWTDDFAVHFSREYIAQWDRKTPADDSVIYKLEICDNPEKTLINPFLGDFEEWNENVTDRSYLYWDGSGGGFIFCTKVSFISDCAETQHTAFRYYAKKCPLFYLREQQEDDYKPRLQVNCSWIIEDRLEEVVWFLIRNHKSRGDKVFDCEDKEIEFE
ncbi:MAG: hypothetical protein LBV74_00315 [Tannerella sp.]|jgi:hypothetical protein|nr:hypothetical protein [Tannerella sp.]